MASVGDRGRELLETYRTARGPDEGQSRRLWDHVRGRLAAGDDVELPADTPRHVGRRWFVAGSLTVAAALLLAVSLDAWHASALHRAETERTEASYAAPSKESRTSRPRRTTATIPGMPAPETVDQPREPVAEATPAAKPAPRQRSRKRPQQPPTTPVPAMTASEIRAETALYKRGQRALAHHDPRTALRIFEEHARTYPSGTLAQERKLQRMVALCRLGNAKQARAEAAVFLREHPGSPLRGHVKRVCVEDSAR